MNVGEIWEYHRATNIFPRIELLSHHPKNMWRIEDLSDNTIGSDKYVHFSGDYIYKEYIKVADNRNQVIKHKIKGWMGKVSK